VLVLNCSVCECMVSDSLDLTAALYLHTLGMCLMAFGGPGVQSSIIHISNLFPSRKATATSVISGCFSLSFAVFLCFSCVWRYTGTPCHQIFFMYSTVPAFFCILTLIAMPDKPFALKEELRHQVEEEPKLAQEWAGKTVRDFERSKLRLPSTFRGKVPQSAMSRQDSFSRMSPIPLKAAPLATQLCSGSFWRVTVLLMVGSYWANFYIGALPMELGDEAYIPESMHPFYLSVFTLISTAGVIGIPVVGHMMDSVGFPTTGAVTVLLAVLWSAGIMMHSGPALLLAFGAYSLFRTFLFSYFFGYLGDAMGFRYFGILSGMSQAAAGVIGLLQYPLGDWAAGDCHLQLTDECDVGKWRILNFLQMGSYIVLLLIPILEYRAQMVKQGMRDPLDSSLWNGSPIVNRKMLNTLPLDENTPLKMQSGGAAPASSSIRKFRPPAVASAGPYTTASAVL
jgi:MFS family permease